MIPQETMHPCPGDMVVSNNSYPIKMRKGKNMEKTHAVRCEQKISKKKIEENACKKKSKWKNNKFFPNITGQGIVTSERLEV